MTNFENNFALFSVLSTRHITSFPARTPYKVTDSDQTQVTFSTKSASLRYDRACQSSSGTSAFYDSSVGPVGRLSYSGYVLHFSYLVSSPTSPYLSHNCTAWLEHPPRDTWLFHALTFGAHRNLFTQRAMPRLARLNRPDDSCRQLSQLYNGAPSSATLYEGSLS